MIENYYYNHDYCINQTTMIAIAAVVCFIKNQQPSSALIILNVIDALTKHFFTLSDILIRIKKSTIPDWHLSRARLEKTLWKKLLRKKFLLWNR